MKRLLASLLTMVALAACASPFAKAETPQQALSNAAQRASQLKSAQFDLTGHVVMTFPPQLAQMMGQLAPGGSATVDVVGNGKAQFPDRYQASMTVKMSSFSIATEVIVANGQAYVKNPLSGKWELSKQSFDFSGQLSEPDPLSYGQLLKNVKSYKDLGDQNLDGTTVHHYQLIPDTDKLLASLNNSAVKNPAALAALKQVLQNGTMTVEVWFGKDDHLVRRVKSDADYNIDLNQLMGALGSGSAAGSQLPAGSTVHAAAQVVINYHDFDKPVTISVPNLA